MLRSLALRRKHDIDIAFQHDTVYRRNRRLVCFDMDSTLIETEVIDELAKLAGVGDKVQKITEAAMRGELDFQASFRKRVSLLKGLPESALNKVRENVPLMEGAERLIGTLKKLGYKTAICPAVSRSWARNCSGGSASITFTPTNWTSAAGLRRARLLARSSTEQRKPNICGRSPRRRTSCLEQVIAVGDGANDLPMLSIAGLGIAFRAKPLVRKNARQSISTLGLDGILFLLGVRDRELLV